MPAALQAQMAGSDSHRSVLPSSESNTERLTGNRCEIGSFSADDLTSTAAAARTAAVNRGKCLFPGVSEDASAPAPTLIGTPGVGAVGAVFL